MSYFTEICFRGYLGTMKYFLNELLNIIVIYEERGITRFRCTEEQLLGWSFIHRKKNFKVSKY